MSHDSTPTGDDAVLDRRPSVADAPMPEASAALHADAPERSLTAQDPMAALPSTPQDGHPPAGDVAAQDESSAGLLDGLDELPVAEHVARFEAVHEDLSNRLTGGAA